MTGYSDLELDNIYFTSNVSWKQIGHRDEKGRHYDFLLIDKYGKTVHTITNVPSIPIGKQLAADYCVKNLGGRHRDLTSEEKSDARVGSVEARLAETEAQLNALKRASEPAADPEGDAAEKPKNKGGRPKKPASPEAEGDGA